MGNDKLIEDAGVSWHSSQEAGTTVHMAREDGYLGHIVISDQIKPDAKEALSALKSVGVQS